MAEALVCNSYWLRIDPPNFYKDSTEDKFDMYPALEELEKGNYYLISSNFSIRSFIFKYFYIL